VRDWLVYKLLLVRIFLNLFFLVSTGSHVQQIPVVSTEPSQSYNQQHSINMQQSQPQIQSHSQLQHNSNIQNTSINVEAQGHTLSVPVTIITHSGEINNLEFQPEHSVVY
jgi:hypothetical protein